MRGFLRFTLGQTVFLNIVFVMLMVVGLFVVFSLPVERYPKVQFGKVQITTYFPGASPEDVEALVTREIEDALEDLDDVEFVSSTSYRERSRILIKFIDDSDYETLYDDLRLKVLSIMGELPASVDPPSFDFIDTDDWLPVVAVNLVGERSNRSLSLMADELKINLLQVPGVREVKLMGEYVREFHVQLDPEKLERYGLTFNQVADAMVNANVSVPAGNFTAPEGDYVILVDEQFRSRDQIMEAIVRTDADGSFLRVRDLVRDAFLAYRDPFVISSVNGEDCVTLQVLKTESGNAISIVEGVRRTCEEVAGTYAAEGVSLVLTQDSTVHINDSMTTLGSNLFLGMVLVSILIWAFMGFRNAALTVIGVPFAFLVTMIFMQLTGNSLNEVTLFAFVLVSGIVVDDAIVVVENIFRHVQDGEALRDAVVNGTAEVFWPVVSATATTVSAFLPMLIMTGSTGEFFALIPKAVTFALVASLLECLLILPIHYLDYGPRKQDVSGDVSHDTWAMGLFRKPLEVMLRMAMRYRWLSLAAVALLLAGALFIAVVSFTGKMPLIRSKFFPDNYNQYYVELDAPVGTPIAHTSRILKEISRELVALGPGVTESTAGFAGFYINESYEPLFSSNKGYVIAVLPPLHDRDFPENPKNDPQVLIDWLGKRFAHYEARQCRIRVRPEKDGPPVGKDVNIRAVGNNAESVRALASEMYRFLKTSPEFQDELIDLVDSEGQPSRVFRFKVDAAAAAEYNLQPAQVTGMTAAVMNGRIIGEFRDQDEQVDLKLEVAGLVRPEDALQVPLLNHPSGPVRLGDLNHTEIYEETGYINRFNGQRAIALTANLQVGSAISPALVIHRVKEHYHKVRAQYPGAALNFRGEYEATTRSYTSLAWAFVISILIIYLVLASQFHSYLQPLIVLSTVAFALIGAIYGAFLSRSLFTVNSFVAIVGVTGVVVNDSLVLVEFLNVLRAKGYSSKEAVFKGTAIRLRPIVLTTLTTTLGLLPMALGIPAYSITWGTMATTFVTGLCTATFLTILMVPVQWDLLETFVAWRRKRKSVREQVQH